VRAGDGADEGDSLDALSAGARNRKVKKRIKALLF
jgi:hypothetical protein